MASRFRFPTSAIACIALAGLPALAQTDVRAALVKHLKTSRDFTLKVADQMPEADYGFKLTPPQMSFAEQMVHLAQDQTYILAPLSSNASDPGKPVSMNKKDVIAFTRQAFDATIDKVSKLTPAQLAKTYNGGEGSMTGLELVMFVLDHTTHHRASAEMYLRAKGITPAEYQF
ncbi:MAG: DinB family protein [Bryobacteraceae bacterium]